MKKVLHIQVLPKLSGVQKVSLEIFRGLDNSEFEKWILFSSNTEKGDMAECVKQFEEAGAKVIFSNKLHREIGIKDIPALVDIYNLCKKEKFDIVHTHSTKPGFIGRIAATLAGVPLVLHTVHGLSFHKFVKFPLWQFYWACEMISSIFCNKIILVNKFYSRYFKWFKNKTTTIYNGMDFMEFPVKGESDSVNLQNNSFVKVLYIGRLDTQKDPITLLKAARVVCEHYPETKFTLVGDGEKYKECLDFIQSNNLINNITLEGWQTDVFKYYSTHDIFAMSSIFESFGLIFLEAGYYKLPVVATNVEGIPEVVSDCNTGLLCNPRDPIALASNIMRLIDDKSLCIKMGEAGFNRVTSMFSSGDMVEKYKQIYNFK